MNDSNKILNPKTGRYVLKTGKIGKELLAELKKPIEPKKPTELKKPIELKKPTELKKPIEPKKPTELKKPIEPIKTVETKKIDINTLKTEWLSIYNKEIKNQITGTLLISID